MKTLLFYDIEASGLSSLDQVLSFAAIRTDMGLNELERHEIEIEWRKDMIPSSEAYLVHHIGMSGRKTCTEAEGVKKIHDLVNSDNTLSGGYNTLGFDDELLRFSFYRCLLPPYTHQYQNGCGRFDVLPLAVFYYLYSNDSIAWPTINNKASFKLEAINEENGWVKGRAHEAMVDVEATLALMKAFRQNEKMWDYLFGFFDKQVDQTRTYQLLKDGKGLGILVGLFMGYDNNYQAPIMFLGPHNAYKNQAILLRLDKPLKEMTKQDLQYCVVRKKFGEPGFVLPYKDAYKARLKEGVDAVVKDNLAYLEKHLAKIKEELLSSSYEAFEGVDLDASLYQKGFLNQQESQWCELFHQRLEESLDVCPNIELKKQALRYLWRNYPDRIPDQDKPMAWQSILDYITSSIDHRNRSGLRIEDAFSQIEQAKESTKDNTLLAGLEEIERHLLSVQKLTSIQHTE